VRKCLRGGHEFLSRHKGNRICEACKSRSEIDLSESFAVVLEGKATQRVRKPLLAAFV
jgi:hypothetical protein